MKRIFSFVLAALLILSLCACGTSDAGSAGDTTGTTAAPAATFKAGFGKVDITPRSPCP